MANELNLIKKDVVDVVEGKIKDFREKGELHFPPNYSPQNAMKSAWLILQETKDKNGNLALEACDRNTVANALLDMVVQGLSPAKKQCYFVVYGNKLQLMRSYMGTVAVTKRLEGVKDVKAYCIYEGDEFETEFDVDTATLKIAKFSPKFENIDIGKIRGAFAVIVGENSPLHVEVMSMAQINKSWKQGYAKGNSGAHLNFTEEMAKKTVINRACKMYANTSDDSDLLIEAFNKSSENEYVENGNVVEIEMKTEIESKANKEKLDFKQEKVKALEIKPSVDEDDVFGGDGTSPFDDDPGF